jgi:phosphoglucomutase
MARLFLGIDIHALSIPVCATALEVLAAKGVEVMSAAGKPFPAGSAAMSHLSIWRRFFQESTG